MIGFIHGVCLYESNGLATFAVGNVGYEVNVFDIPRVWISSHDDTNSELWWIHEYAPQDSPHELYGFRERSERDLFRVLLTIKGVGPKVAMRIVGNKGVQYSKDRKSLVAVSSTLMAIRGVGATLAHRIMEFCQ